MLRPIIIIALLAFLTSVQIPTTYAAGNQPSVKQTAPLQMPVQEFFGKVGEEFPTAQLYASGGSPSGVNEYFWFWEQEKTTPGLNMTIGGRIFGTPTAAGTYIVPVLVVDNAHNQLRGTIKITIDTVPPQRCTSRPQIEVKTSRNGTNRLHVTLTVQGYFYNTQDSINAARIQVPVNAQIQTAYGWRVDVIHDNRFDIPVGSGTGMIVIDPTQLIQNSTGKIEFDLVRTGQGTIIMPITLATLCGEWRTFVGSGANAF